MPTNVTYRFTVRTQDDARVLLDRETYEAAHYEAYGIYEQTGLQIEVVKGDSLIWDSRNGYHCA